MRTRFHNETLAEKNNTWTHDRKQMWLPDAHLCYLILKAARPCVAVLLHGAATSSAISPQMHQQNPADAPPESRGTIRIRRTPTESCLHLQREEVHGKPLMAVKHLANLNELATFKRVLHTVRLRVAPIKDLTTSNGSPVREFSPPL